jgi:hypothetical protein
VFAGSYRGPATTEIDSPHLRGRDRLSRCGIGFSGGRCPSLADYVTRLLGADYVTGTGATKGATAPPEDANVGHPPCGTQVRFAVHPPPITRRRPQRRGESVRGGWRQPGEAGGERFIPGRSFGRTACRSRCTVNRAFACRMRVSAFRENRHKTPSSRVPWDRPSEY